ncbi:MAG: flagellar biosynthetic protein FliO [Chitinispirillaceae bacterium]
MSIVFRIPGMGRIHALALVILVFSTGSLVAQENEVGSFDINKVRQTVATGTDTSFSTAEEPPVQRAQENYALVILRIMGYLAIITALIFAVAWVVKKAGLAGASKVGGGGSMDILEVLSFGQNRNAVLVRVMDTVYLLGQTPGNIVLLEKIEGQKAIDIISSSRGGSNIMHFKDAFNSFLGKMKKS